MKENIKVDGQEITPEKLQEMQTDPKIKLKEVTPKNFQKLERLQG